MQAGILGTYADGTFRPYLYVTRAEYAKILVVVEEIFRR
ncbi:MAG: S-layer homology domain-containing protein [Acetivibrionales bacterium]